MIRKVTIIDKPSKQIVAEYPVKLSGGEHFKEDYFDEAWENAIDDGLVDKSKRADYFMKFSGDDPVYGL